RIETGVGLPIRPILTRVLMTGARVPRYMLGLGRRTMTVKRLVHALTLALLLAPGAARADAPFSLEEAVRLALTNNERARQAPLRVEVAEGGLDKARTAFLPTLSAAGTGSLHPLDKNSRVLSGNGTITLTQPVLNLSSIPLYAQARHTLESERWGAA